MQGSFYTDHDQAQEMQAHFESLYFRWMQGLNAYVTAPQPQRPSGGSAIGQRPSNSQPASIQPLSQPFLQHQQQQYTKGSAYGLKYNGGPDSGNSAQGETVSALHAQLPQSSMHPNPNFNPQSPGRASGAPPQHQQQYQQQYTHTPLPEAEAYVPRSAPVKHLSPQGVSSTQQYTAVPSSTQPPISDALFQAQFFPRATAPAVQTLSTPFASMPLQTSPEVLPTDGPSSPSRLLPPRSQTSLDTASNARHARRVAQDLMNRCADSPRLMPPKPQFESLSPIGELSMQHHDDPRWAFPTVCSTGCVSGLGCWQHACMLTEMLEYDRCILHTARAACSIIQMFVARSDGKDGCDTVRVAPPLCLCS